MSSDSYSSKDSSGSDSESDADSYVSDGDEDDDKSEDEEVEHEDEPLADVLKQIAESESQDALVHIPSNLNVDEIQKEKYKRNPVRDNNDHLLHQVSDEHVKLISEMKSQGLFESNEVEEIMSKVDFTWFYKEWAPDWPYTNAKMLQSTLKVLRKGIDILSFPLNIYYNVCLALMIGHEGSVICFGHAANINMLKFAGLDFLEKDDRLRFRFASIYIKYDINSNQFQLRGFDDVIRQFIFIFH